MPYTVPSNNSLNIDDLHEFEKVIFETKFEDDESDPNGALRMVKIAYALAEYYEHINAAEDLPRDYKDKYMMRLRERLFEFEIVFGVTITDKNYPEIFSDEFERFKKRYLNSQMKTDCDSVKSATKTHAKSKLHQVIEHILTENPNVSINDVWMEFYDNQDEELFDLIEIKTVSDPTLQTATLEWVDCKTGTLGKSVTRKTVATIISKIRKEILNK